MYDVDETYAVYDEQCPTARKEHKCQACGELIQKGQRYYRVGMSRDHESYVVRAVAMRNSNRSSKLYWPRANKLVPYDDRYKEFERAVAARREDDPS